MTKKDLSAITVQLGFKDGMQVSGKARLPDEFDLLDNKSKDWAIRNAIDAAALRAVAAARKQERLAE